MSGTDTEVDSKELGRQTPSGEHFSGAHAGGANKYGKNSYRRFLLKFARACLQEGNVHHADLALQICQQRYPQDPVAFNLRAILANALGMVDKAMEFLDAALAVKPDFQQALENHKVMYSLAKQRGAAKQLSGQPRFLLIHAYGGGFGLELLYLLKQLLLSEITQRIPVVYWGKNSLYNGDPSSDCFTNYFEPINAVKIEQLYPLQENVFPQNWQFRALTDYEHCTGWHNKKNGQIYRLSGVHYLNRRENLVVSGEFTSIKTLLSWSASDSEWAGVDVAQAYRRLARRYLRPQLRLVRQALEFIEVNFFGQPFLAIHLLGSRGSDPSRGDAINQTNEQLLLMLSRHEPDLPIFVMTNDVRELARARKHFGMRVRYTSATRIDGQKPSEPLDVVDKRAFGEHVMTDILISARAQHFYGCGLSHLACAVAYLRDEDQHSTLVPYDVNTRFSDVPVPGMFGIK